jgi:hypothetical protein
MTVKELIKALQDLGEEKQDMEVLIYDEYRYVNIYTIKTIEEPDYLGQSKRKFIGID